MIPTIILWLVGKYKTNQKQSAAGRDSAGSPMRFFRKKAILILSGMCLLGTAISQEQSLVYNVVYHGNQIGKMKVSQLKKGDDLYMKVNTNTSLRMILSIKVNQEEESHFRNGKMLYSTVKRSVNGKEKANRHTVSAANGYQLDKEGKRAAGSQAPIIYNVHLLLRNEPRNLQKVYSDNYQEYLSVEKLAEHKYRLKLPDGNYNIYYFRNGICEALEINHSMYTLHIALETPMIAAN